MDLNCLPPAFAMIDAFADQCSVTTRAAAICSTGRRL